MSTVFVIVNSKDVLVSDKYYDDLKAVNLEIKKLNNYENTPRFHRKKLTLAAPKTGLRNVEFDSSTLEKGQYDNVNQVLKVKFKNGNIYKYLDVPPDVFGELVAADSQGSFFAKEIKGQYDYKKMRKSS